MASAYDRAVDLLARRSHFRRELETKLRARGFADDEVSGALARLEDQGYLDDGRTARELVASARARRGWGRARLVAELRRKGVDGEALEAALAGIDDEAELALARAEASRWRRGGAAAPASLARRLARKGFPSRVIFAVLEELGADSDPFGD